MAGSNTPDGTQNTAGSATAGSTPTAGAPAVEDTFDAIFDSLFEESTDDKDPPSGTDDGAAGAAQDGKGPDDGGGSPAGAKEPSQPGGDPVVEDADPKPAGDGDDGNGGQAAPPTGLSEVEQLRAELAELKRASAAQPAAAPAAGAQATAPAAGAPVEDAPPPVYTDAEAAELATLREQWPESSRLIELMGRQMMADTLRYAFSEIAAYMRPMEQYFQSSATSDHEAAILEAHPDYADVRDAAIAWVDKQPEFIKAAYQKTIAEGSAADVIALLSQFKQYSGYTAPTAVGTAAKPAVAPPQGQAAPTLSEAAKKAATTLGVVDTKRGATSQAADPNDFDGEWEAITRKA